MKASSRKCGRANPGSLSLIEILVTSRQQMMNERLWTFLELNKLAHPKVITSVTIVMQLQLGLSRICCRRTSCTSASNRPGREPMPIATVERQGKDRR